MGLDMWIFSGCKPKETEINEVLHIYKLNEMGYFCIPKEDIESNVLKDLAPISVQRKCKITKFDGSRLFKDFGIPSDARKGGFNRYPDKTQYRFFDSENNCIEIELTDDEFASYEIEVIEDFYVTRLDEITYFRNEYDLQADISEIYHAHTLREVENGGYHHLTIEMIEDLNKENALFREEGFGIATKESSLYFHEWF